MPTIQIPHPSGSLIFIHYPIGKELAQRPTLDIISENVSIKFKGSDNEHPVTKNPNFKEVYIVPQNISYNSLQRLLNWWVEIEYLATSDGKKLNRETGVIIGLNERGITISDEGPSSVDEFGTGMGGTNTIPISSYIAYRRQRKPGSLSIGGTEPFLILPKSQKNKKNQKRKTT